MPALIVSDVSKSFTMHLQGGIALPVLHGVSLHAKSGQCTVLAGPSGVGKSSILRMIYGNYAVDRGRISVSHRGAEVDLARATPREIIEIRRETVGYVSQFLRVIPRVSALDVVAEPLLLRGAASGEAQARARELLARLNLPERLWTLPPATFSGGEQQRVNIARGFIAHFPVLLLDEPTASLDETNRAIVMDMIAEKKRQDVALVGIFHDPEVRAQIADTLVDVGAFQPRARAA